MTSTNSSVSNENFSLTNSGRSTIPLKQVNQPVQRKGSVILDPLTNILYFSDGITWIPVMSGSAMGGGLTTVGTVGATFTSIAEAYAAGIDDMRVITSINETVAVDLSTGPKHVRIEVAPGVDITNSIAGITTPWFTGDDTLLNIVGAGAHIDDTTAGLSSRIVLQAGQSLRSGTDAELNTRDMRYSGSGSNTLTAGTSTIENCRFDTAGSFNFNGFVDNLYVNNCFFESDINIESPGVLAASGVIFTNNNFESSNLNVNAASFSASNISNNIWTGATGLSTVNPVNDVTIIGNTMSGPMTLSSTMACSTVSNNTTGLLTFTGNVTDSTIDGNTTTNILFSGNIGATDLPVSFTGNLAKDGSIIVVGAATDVVFTDNYAETFIRFEGANFLLNFANNTATANDGMRFQGIVDHSAYIGNTCVNGSMTFTSPVSESNFSSNRTTQLLFFDTVGLDNEPVSITGNTLSRIDIRGAATELMISGNACTQTIVFDDIATFVSVVGNVGSSFRCVGDATSVVVSDNNFSSGFRFDCVTTNSTISGNRSGGDIEFGVFNGEDSTGLTIIGNNLDSGNAIEFGDDFFGVVSDSTIIGNIATGGITCNPGTSGNTNTIVGNRVAGGGINGFASDAASTGLNV